MMRCVLPPPSVLLGGLVALLFVWQTVVKDLMAVEHERWRLISIPDWLNADWDADMPKLDPTLDAILAEIASRKPDFVVVPGDLVRGHWVRTATPAKAIRELGARYYPVWLQRFRKHGLQVMAGVGDHELGDDGWNARKISLLPVFRETLRRHVPMPDNGPSGVDLCAWYRRHKDLLLICIDPFELHGNKASGRQRVELSVTGKQLAWVDQVLTQHADARYRLIMGHVPILPGFKHRMSSRLAMKGGRKSPLWRLMVRHRVDAYLCGEVHTVSCQRADGIEQIVHGSNIGWAGSPDSNFLVIEAGTDGLDFSIHELPLIIPAGAGRRERSADIRLPKVEERQWRLRGRLRYTKTDAGRAELERRGCFK